MRSGVLVMRYSTGNLDALAERYADEIQAIDPTGPYWIGGNCQGGVIAIEIAKKLFQRGYHVALLSLLDTVVADRFPTAPYPGRVSLFYGTLSRLNPLRIFRTPELGWRKLSPEGLIVRYVPVDHGEFFVEGGHLLIDLLREAESWASQLRAEPDRSFVGALPNTAYRARIQLPPEARVLEPGQETQIRAHVRNRGIGGLETHRTEWHRSRQPLARYRWRVAPLVRWPRATRPRCAAGRPDRFAAYRPGTVGARQLPP